MNPKPRLWLVGRVQALLPQSLVGRVFALYTFSLLLFVVVGLALFYRYQFETALEDAQESSVMLTEATALTITDSAVIGDYDTIQRTLTKVIARSPFDSASFIDTTGAVLKATIPTGPRRPSPDWLKGMLSDHLHDVNQVITAGGRDYGVLRLSFDEEAVAAQLWGVIFSALLLGVAGLLVGSALIWMPLRKWLGTLDRALDVGKSQAPESAPQIDSLLRDLPLEFRPMVQTLNLTASHLRQELDTRDRALVSLREVLADLQGSDAPASRDTELDLAQMSASVARLVSEREASRQALERARDAALASEAVKSGFIANVSHELRTPLQSVLGFSELALNRPLPPERLKSVIGDIHAAGGRMLKLVNEILDISRFESSMATLDLTRGDLREVIEGVVHEVSPIAVQRDIELVALLPPRPAQGSFNAFRLAQVVRNVMANALRFAPSGSAIQLGLECDSKGCTITVRDHGPGIPEGELERIFEPFTQSSRTDDGAGGTGLGLTISRSIMKAHRGTITASNAPDGGAVFRIWLPAEASSVRLDIRQPAA